MMAVNTGDKYWIVTALANGIFCSVMKNRLRAVTPKIPLNRRNFLLFPNGLIPLGKSMDKLKTNEITLLKRINS